MELVVGSVGCGSVQTVSVSVDHRSSVCPPLLSGLVSRLQPPGPIALHHQTSTHTSQNGSVNKSPLWF